MVISISSQPTVNSIFSAYRPIIFEITTDMCPVVYCDVYINNVFYKTISRTQFLSVSTSVYTWRFDIEDACQEYLKNYIAPNGFFDILAVSQNICSVVCKFRSSTIDSNGFTVPDTVVPIQATGLNVAVSGTGTLSNSISVLNSVLQHVDNQDLITHLSAFKIGTWSSSTFPLTQRKTYKICKQDTDAFSIISDTAPNCITITYKNKGDSNSYELTSCSDICIPVTIGSYDLGTATNGVPYDVIIPLNGSSPFTVDVANSNYPSWMILNVGTVLGVSQLEISGTPDADNNLSTVDIIVTNCSGLNTVDIVGNTPGCIGVTINSITLTDAQSGVFYSVDIMFSGDSPFVVNGTSTTSTGTDWAFTDIANGVRITGTPTDADVAAGITFGFHVSNCSGINSADFSQHTNVLAAGSGNPGWLFIGNTTTPNGYYTLKADACAVINTGFSIGSLVYLNAIDVNMDGSIAGNSTLYTNSGATVPYHDTTLGALQSKYRVIRNNVTGNEYIVLYQTDVSEIASVTPEVC